jgi:translocator protein
VLLTVSVCFALGWAYLFYVPHLLLPAALCLLMAAALTWVLLALAWRANPAYGLGLLVYAVWLSVATALAFSYAQRN